MRELKPVTFSDPACGPYGEWIEHEAEEQRKERSRSHVESIRGRIAIAKERPVFAEKEGTPATPSPSEQDAEKHGPELAEKCVYLVETWKRVSPQSDSLPLNTAILDIASLLSRIESEATK
jgi:hypothetical protein